MKKNYKPPLPSALSNHLAYQVSLGNFDKGHVQVLSRDEFGLLANTMAQFTT
ncbi:MAG: hypothetical protein J6V63_03500 [Spirochaetaceae bacterium]|nr:hypothetical protein [Spirochaetaceae bacterium]